MKTLNNTNLMTLAILTGLASLTLTSASFAGRRGNDNNFRRQVQSYDAPVIYCQTNSYGNSHNDRYVDKCRDHDEKRWVKAVRIVANAIIKAHRKPRPTIVYVQPLPQQTVVIRQPRRPVEVTYVREYNRRPNQWNNRTHDKQRKIVRKNNRKNNRKVDKKVTTKNRRPNSNRR
jgi:hypothetical protein